MQQVLNLSLQAMSLLFQWKTFKPFLQKYLTYNQRICNYRSSRTRRVIESVFGILGTKFRMFHTTITLSPEKVKYVVLPCIVLHNVWHRKCCKNYFSGTMIDQEDTATASITLREWRQHSCPSNAFHNLKKSCKHHAFEKANESRDCLLYTSRCV